MPSNFDFLDGSFKLGADFFPQNRDVELEFNGVTHSIGKHSYGLDLVRLRAFDRPYSLRVGRFCSFADNINLFLAGNHMTDWISTASFNEKFFPSITNLVTQKKTYIEKHSSKGDVIIGHDVWIGSFATIMSGVRIGNGAVIATNAHVVKDVPPYAIVGGNPARVIRFRFSEEVIDLLLQLKWWELEDHFIDLMLPILTERPSRDVLKLLIAECEYYARSDNLAPFLNKE